MAVRLSQGGCMVHNLRKHFHQSMVGMASGSCWRMPLSRFGRCSQRELLDALADNLSVQGGMHDENTIAGDPGQTSYRISSTSKRAEARSSKDKYEAASYSLSAPFSGENDDEYPMHDDGCRDDDVDHRPRVCPGAGSRASDGHAWRHGS